MVARRVLLSDFQGPMEFPPDEWPHIAVSHDYGVATVQAKSVGYYRLDDRSEELTHIFVLPERVQRKLREQRERDA